MEAISNYEKLCLEWRQRFQHMDQGRLCRLLPGLSAEEDFLTLEHFARVYAIDRRTGEITAPHDPDPVTQEEQLNIYTLFGYCRDDARLTGRWVPFRELEGASPFAPAFELHVLRPMAAAFSGRIHALKTAAAALGGIPLPHSDAGFQLYAFPGIPMQFLFWDSDEEFPAQANILYDAGVTRFIHVESTVSLAGEGLRRLLRAAGLPVPRSAFGM